MKSSERLRAAAVFLALCAATPLVAGCSPEGPGGFIEAGTPPADGSGGGDGGACMAGQWVCNAGDVARQCDGRGGFTVTQMCRDMGMVCAVGVGCSECAPGQRRCKEDNPNATQRCSMEGRWEDGPICDPNEGRTCNNGLCEDRCNSGDATYLGCEYWPAVTPTSQLDSVFRFAVTLANPQSYEVRAEVSGGALRSPLVRLLEPGAVTTVELPWVTALSQNIDEGTPATSALVGDGAYHVRANGPIAAYQFNPLTYQNGSAFSYTADASLLLPTRVLTNYYVVGTRTNWQAVDDLGRPVAVLGGFVSVIPVQGEVETTVNVRLTAAVRAGTGVTASGPGMRTFNVPPGGVLQLVGRDANQDLTGTIIEGSGPLAVFVGHDCTNIPADRPACDHLEEQLLPAATWGKRYIVSQLRDRTESERSRVRIIAQRDGVDLTFTGITRPTECGGTLNAGRFCEFETDRSFVVEGSQPFLVLQFMLGQGAPAAECCPDPPLCRRPPPNVPQCMGDPAMVSEVPIEQFRPSYDFLVPSTYVRNVVNVVAPADADITIDGVPLMGTAVNIEGGYKVWYVQIMPGRHNIRTNNDRRFGIKVYGVAPYTSYMYPGGLDLLPISPIG